MQAKKNKQRPKRQRMDNWEPSQFVLLFFFALSHLSITL